MRSSLAVLLVIVLGLFAARGDEPPVFYGRDAAGWARILRDEASRDADRRRACWALACLGPEARVAVPDLVDAVKQGRSADDAVHALVEIGVEQELTVPYLVEQFRSQAANRGAHERWTGISGYICEDLAKVGKPVVPSLVEILKDEGLAPEARPIAVEILGKIGPAAGVAVPTMIEVIAHPRPPDGESRFLGEIEQVTSLAIRALGKIGPAASEAAPILEELLRKENDLHPEIVIALDGMGKPPIRMLADAILADDDPDAASLLSELGPRAREAVPSLRHALGDARRQVRLSAAAALAYIDPTSLDAVPILVEALGQRSDPDLNTLDVLPALVRLGPASEAALPALIRLTEGEDCGEDELKALVQIDPEGKRCVPALIAALKREENGRVAVAARCLGLIGPRAKAAVPALLTTLTRDFREFFANGVNPQTAAARALRRIRPEPREVIPALIAALRYRHVVRMSFDIGGDQPEKFEDADREAAAAAAWLLGDYGPEATAAIPTLLEAARERDPTDARWDLRRSAILALGRIGPHAGAAVPTLLALLREDGRDSSCQPELLASLSRLAPDGKGLAEVWLSQPRDVPGRWGGFFAIEDRVLVARSLGRSNFESDWLSRYYLEQIASILRDAELGQPLWIEHLEELFDKLGRLGPAARSAVPRLIWYRKHSDPAIRASAADALEEIAPEKAGSGRGGRH